MSNTKLAELRGLVAEATFGLQKLAELTAQERKQAASPVPTCDPAEVGKLAESAAAKIAALGCGQATDVPHNAAILATDHISSLRAFSSVLDYLQGSSAKNAESPAGLGRPVGASIPVKTPTQSYRPVRC